MQREGGRRPLARILLGLTFALSACSGHTGLGTDDSDDAAINVVPTNYKSDILAAMHAYLNDPTGIRDAALSQPMLQPVDGKTRYVVCVRFNGKMNGDTYAGEKDIAAVFLGGRFDRFLEKAREQCAGATYASFPELEKLTR
ncbi:MAG TPA: hypothetical protein VGJ20_08705 [Xanthobacteraceae bacterium]